MLAESDTSRDSTVVKTTRLPEASERVDDKSPRFSSGWHVRLLALRGRD
jgi:hypothetical protein